jgi:hypothetical protein
MSKIPILMSSTKSSIPKNMVPKVSELLEAASEKIVEVETRKLADSLKKLINEFDSIVSSPELKSSSAKKLSVSLAIRADGSIGIPSLASARNSIQSSMTLEFEID